MTVYSTVVKEIMKYQGINHIVKLSSMAAEETGLATQLDEYIKKKKKSLKNLEYLIHFYVLLHLCKIS
jgi:repressor of nif and glnA expression